MSNFHEFQADSGIVHHLIHNQNGTIETSLIELICNSIDAGASSIKVTLSSKHFEILDNGSGFKDKDEIMKYFKKFGTPHKDGDSTFGRFRIGRGQIISFTDAIWHSKNFKMKTCTKNNSYGFEFNEYEDIFIDGCKVYGNFKTPIRDWDLSSIEKSIIKKLQYISSNIVINGIPITIDDNNINWDYEDDDLKIIWNPRREDGLMLYSQGVFIKNITNHYYDLNADIITKNALKLNMARNETNDSDPVWIKINSLLISRSQELAKKEIGTRKLSEKVRRGLVGQFLSGQLSFEEANRISLLKDCRGHTISISNLVSKKMPLCISQESGHRKSEWLSMRGTAIILDHDEARIWDVDTAEDLIFKIRKILLEKEINSKYKSKSYFLKKLDSILFIDFNKMTSDINEDMITLKNSELNSRESAARNAIQSASDIMAKRLSKLKTHLVKKRKIIIGKSTLANAWTDSSTYIAISKHMLPLLDSGYYGAVQISLLLLHEYIHDSSSFESHKHDFEFYQQFHDLSTHSNASTEVTGHVASSMMHKYNTELANKMEAFPKEIYKHFKYPIVNDLEEYEIFLGKKGISDFGRMLLAMTPYFYKITKSKIILKKPKYEKRNSRAAYTNNLIKMTKDFGYKFKDHSALELEFGFELAMKLEKEDLINGLKFWLSNNNHDETLAEILISSEQYCTYGNLIDVLIEDKKSDILYYTTTNLLQVYKHGSKNHCFDFQSDVGYYNARQPIDIANNKSDRFSEVKKSMVHALNGLTKEEERIEFIKQFLSDDFSRELLDKD